MTPKQKKFADAYIECGIQTRAAIEAGYKKKSAHTTAWRLVNNEEIRLYIARKTDVFITEGSLILKILHAMEIAEDLCDIRAFLHGCELLAKIKGLFRDKAESRVSGHDEYANLSDEEIDRRLAKHGYTRHHATN